MVFAFRSLASLAGAFLLFGTGCASTGEPAATVPPELEADLQRQGTVEERVDTVVDVRSWQLHPINVTGDPFIPGVSESGRELRIGAIATITGPEHPVNPGHSGIQILFMGVSDDWLYRDEDVDTVELLLDGEDRLELRIVTYDDSPGQGYVVEVMNAPVSIELLDALTEASFVEGRLGSVEFALADRELEGFREFRDALPPEIR